MSELSASRAADLSDLVHHGSNRDVIMDIIRKACAQGEYEVKVHSDSVDRCNKVWLMRLGYRLHKCEDCLVISWGDTLI